MYIYIYIHTHTHTYVPTYVYTYIYIYIYTYIYIEERQAPVWYSTPLCRMSFWNVFSIVGLYGSEKKKCNKKFTITYPGLQKKIIISEYAEAGRARRWRPVILALLVQKYKYWRSRTAREALTSSITCLAKHHTSCLIPHAHTSYRITTPSDTAYGMRYAVRGMRFG